MTMTDHMMVPSAFPLTRPPDDSINLPMESDVNDNVIDGSVPFANEWDALLNDPVALDNLLASNTNYNIPSQFPSSASSSSSFTQPPLQPSHIGTSSSGSFSTPSGPPVDFATLARSFDTTPSQPLPPPLRPPGQPSNAGCPPPHIQTLDLSMLPHIDVSSSPPAPPPSINSPFDTISNPFSPVVTTPGSSGFPAFFPHGQSSTDLLQQQQRSHLNQHHYQQQRRSLGFQPSQLPSSDSYYQQVNRRYSQFTSSPRSPPAFQFAPYLLNGETSTIGHSPTNSFHSSRPHTQSNLNPNPPIFSPALSSLTDHNPFEFSHVVPPRPHPQQQSPLSSFPSRFEAGPTRPVVHTDELAPSYTFPNPPPPDPKTSATATNDKPVSLASKYNKYKRRSLPGSRPKDHVDSLIVDAKGTENRENNVSKDPLSSNPTVLVADNASDQERASDPNPPSTVNAVKGGPPPSTEIAIKDDKDDEDQRQPDQDREPSPLVERKPRPIQELLQNWDRSPTPPPLLTGPPYRVKTESPESLKRLESRRGKIVVRGGSLIGLGLGFSPKDEEEENAGCICDPLGLSGKDCWRQTSSSGGSRTRTTSRDVDHEDNMDPNAVSGVVAGVKRKSGEDSKGKLRELQPSRPGTNTMLGKSNLELPPGHSAAHQAAMQAPKRKKPRIALSCAQCTKRKQKCNRQIPCQHCTCESGQRRESRCHTAADRGLPSF
jgi:hypothetical protein